MGHDAGPGWIVDFINHEETFLSPQGIRYRRKRKREKSDLIITFDNGLSNINLKKIKKEKEVMTTKNKDKGNNLCAKCGGEILPTGKRGRPAKIHPECKDIELISRKVLADEQDDRDDSPIDMSPNTVESLDFESDTDWK